jgi:hypothetical protein
LVATSALIRLKTPLSLPDITIAVDTTAPTVQYTTVICRPRLATHPDTKKVNPDLIEILAVDSNADLIADYSFCIPKSDIDLWIWDHLEAGLDVVASVINSNGVGHIDVRPYDLGYAGGAEGPAEAPILAQSAPGATTETDLYEVPAGQSAEITSIWIANRGAATTFRISVSVGGGATANKDYLHYDITIDPTTSIQVDIPEDGIKMSAGDILRIYAGAATLSFTATGKVHS